MNGIAAAGVQWKSEGHEYRAQGPGLDGWAGTWVKARWLLAMGCSRLRPRVPMVIRSIKETSAKP